MSGKIKNFLIRTKKRIIGKNLTADFRMLYFSRVTINSATQLMGLFLPIFLYQFFGLSLALTIIFYISIDTLYAGLITVGCQQIMNRIGIKRSLQISVFLGALYYVLFFIIDRYVMSGELLPEISRFWWLAPIIFFSLLFRLTHWIPYHTDMTKLTGQHNRARQLSLMEATMMAMGAIMPIIAGLVLSYLGYGVLFLLASSIYLISIIPFSRLPKVEEKFSWSFCQTWRHLFSKKMRPSVLAYAGDGAESVAGSVIWPIFIWQILEGNYFRVGAISSFIIIATIFLQLSAGGFMDKFLNRRRWLRYGSLLYSLGWIFKALVGTAFQVFIFSTFHNFSRVFSRTSFDALNYDIAADQGHYVDEYTVIRETAIMLGKILMGIFILLITPFFPLRSIFFLAALASLFMSLLKQNEAFKD